METANSQSCTYCCCFVPKIHFFLTVTQLAEDNTVKKHGMTLLWDRLGLLQQDFITVEGSKSLLTH